MNYSSYPLHQSDELLFQISQDLPMELVKIKGENNNQRCNENKKIIHRENERQRRNEMNTLYASLRSLLPLEDVKGKRSISDHLDEAVNYMKFLQKKIQELSNKRDELKRLSISKTPVIVTENSSPSEFVIVRSSWIGLEVVICSNLRDGVVVPLSRVLELLVEEGLAVVNCVSTKVNERSIYTIQSEVSKPANFNASALQQKLMELVKSANQIAL